ncbi:MAG TPA: coproporphyrinogen-III oxidase family protein [Candidatus Deferrimicrobium sp.]|nr:coproporphyrinogen-III oxidase family protein [Candidatus Deferrimicrobium sp.]
MRPARSAGGPPEGLYIHIPFCVSICPYCDFVVMAGGLARGPRNRIAELLEAAVRELDLRIDRLEVQLGGTPPPLVSVYLGGGTPSLLSPAQVGRLLGRVSERLGLAADAEVTLEANPGPDELGDLAGFRAAGVNRLSIGAQSLADAELRRLGRRHRAADIAAAVRAARAAGLRTLSLDLLTDIPGQTLDSWRRTLGRALDLGPDHLSVYTLTLDDPEAEGLSGPGGDHLPVSRGASAWRERARREQSEDRAVEMELLTDDLAEAAGLHRYEIANLARAGFASRHNLLYWRRRPYLAIGPGAHASDGARRRTWNGAPVDGYLAALADGRLPPGGSDEVDADTAIAESAILGLRLVEGIDSALSRHPLIAPGLAWARQHGLAEDGAGRTRLTGSGRLLANEVFARLLPAAGRGQAGVPAAGLGPSA